MKNYDIIDCNVAHKDFILNLNKKNMPAVGLLNDDLFSLFLHYSDYFKIIKNENTLIGFTIALLPGQPYDSINYKWFENRYNSFVYIDRIIISSDYQNMGIGTLFYDHIKRSFRNQFKFLVCEINLKPKNSQSINFHKKYGFKHVGQQYTEKKSKLVSMQLLSF